jgi:hypothetical protein
MPDVAASREREKPEKRPPARVRVFIYDKNCSTDIEEGVRG